MIEIQCPRCKQYWYSNDDEGNVRLCSRCVDHLRLKRGHRAEIDVPFLLAAGVALFLDLLLMLLTALMPALFGKVILVLGGLLFFVGMMVLRVLQKTGWFVWGIPLGGEIDWHIGRWALLMVLSGLALMGAYGAFAGMGR